MLLSWLYLLVEISQAVEIGESYDVGPVFLAMHVLDRSHLVAIKWMKAKDTCSYSEKGFSSDMSWLPRFTRTSRIEL